MTGTGADLRRRPRLVVLSTHPIQYYAPLYRCIAERGVVDIKVIYLSDAGAVAHHDAGFSRVVEWDVPLLTGYDFEVLQPGTPITSRHFWSRSDRGLEAALARSQADWILIYGYASRMNWVAVWWAKRHRVKVSYSSDSNARDPHRRYLVPLKRLVLRHFFGLVDRFLATSEANVEYLLRFGADRGKVRRMPFAIDVQRFMRPASLAGRDLRPYDFVWAGKFTQTKRPDDFVKALGIIALRSPRTIRARLIGDGPCREQVLELCARLPAACNVEFAGFLNQLEMPAALREAETLVFTSELEAYGLIATEAAASGLALILADNIGCVGATVLARPGVNSITYKVGDVQALAGAMERVLGDAEMRQRMQSASIEIAAEHDVSRAAEVMERVVSEGTANA